MSGTATWQVQIEANISSILSEVESLKNQLDAVEKKTYKIELDLDTKQLNSVISDLNKMLKSLGKGTGDFKQFENLSKEFSNITKNIQGMNKALGGVNDKGISNLLSSIQNIDSSLSNLSNHIIGLKDDIGNVGNSSGLDQMAKDAEKAKAAIDGVKKAQDGASKGSVFDTSEWKKGIAVIEEYFDAQTKLNNLIAKNSGKKEGGDYSEQLKEYTTVVSGIGERAAIARDSLSELAIPGNVITSWGEFKTVLEAWKSAGKGSTESIARMHDAIRNFNASEISKYESAIKSLETSYNKLNSREYKSEKYSSQLEELSTKIGDLKNKLKDLRDHSTGSDIISEADVKNMNLMLDSAQTLEKTIKNIPASNRGSNLSQRSNVFKMIAEMKQFIAKTKESKSALDAMEKSYRAQGDNLNVSKAIGELKEFKTMLIETGQAGKSFFSQLKEKAWFSWVGNLASMVSIYDVFNKIKEGVETITSLDTALTEMRKVSNESVSSLKAYQSTTFDTANDVGTTAQVIQNSTADWMRLGESMNEAAESARTSNVLLNVSEFDSIDSATESLVAMSQAYKDLDKMQIVDVLNNIGNNFSISTDGLATALQDSASSLTTAGNDLNEAVALITAGNAVTQDPAKVGAGLRTISLRLVGTEAAKSELESLGEDTSDVITTTSKLRDTIISATKAATNGKGFDILDANGNYKSTYEIMQGLSDIYDDIVESDKKLGTNNLNLLLETIAGKNRSNIAASILQNGDMLREVYQQAQDSDGSAEKELDAYLDSIEGKMAQLKNRGQEFWATTINTEAVKSVISFLTEGLNLVTQLVDKIGLIGPALAAIGGVKFFKNLGLFYSKLATSYTRKQRKWCCGQVCVVTF